MSRVAEMRSSRYYVLANAIYDKDIVHSNIKVLVLKNEFRRL